MRQKTRSARPVSRYAMAGLLGAAVLAAAASPAPASVRASAQIVRAGEAIFPNPTGLVVRVGNSGTQTLKAFRLTLPAGTTFSAPQENAACSFMFPSQVVCTVSSPPGNVNSFAYNTTERQPDCAAGKLEASGVGPAGPFVPASIVGPLGGRSCPWAESAGLAVASVQIGRVVAGKVTDVPAKARVRVELFGNTGRAPAFGTAFTVPSAKEGATSFRIKLNARGRRAFARSRKGFKYGLKIIVRSTVTFGDQPPAVTAERVTLHRACVASLSC